MGIMVSFSLGLVIPDLSEAHDPRLEDSFAVTQWWRFMLGFPALLVLIQSLLMVFVFPFDTPKMHKQRNELIIL